MGFEQAVGPYVLITPAHNEEKFIEETISSMIAQKTRPLKWVIVNDASTDRTQEIVEQYTAHYDFLQLINFNRPAGRDFGNKVRAFNRGLAEVQGLDYKYIGNLDADISLEKDYFEKILYELDRDPNLGIAGGMVSYLSGDKFVSYNMALDSVDGAVQLFRRACFEQIGGYIALPKGGIDGAAEITARHLGWKVRTFPEIHVREHRRAGWAAGSSLSLQMEEGCRLYALGYSLSFIFARCVYRSMERPRILGSCAAFFGYLLAFIKREPIVLPPDVVQFLRAEQRGKLVRSLLRLH